MFACIALASRIKLTVGGELLVEATRASEGEVIHPVLQILNVGDIAELVRAERTDGQLLDLFVKTRDQDAFATLVRRHGGLVLGVCRRVLRDPADADDAFQAAFLVLARKAATLRSRGLLANWLHGVAFNTARRLQRANSRRATRERPLADVPEPIAEDGIDLREELLAILDEELGRLPERYRVPIVLCDLQGGTRKEAARMIGCPEGTVAGRLARARAMLAERLAGRGIVPTAGILAAVLSAREASAGVLVGSVMRAVGGGIVSVRVASLAERVVAAMFVNKLKSAFVAVLMCGLVFAGLATVFRANAIAEPIAPLEEKIAKPDPAKPAGDKQLAVFPLKRPRIERIPEVIIEAYRKVPGVTVAWSEANKSLLVYADEKNIREIDTLLQQLREEPRKLLTVVTLKNVKHADAAKTINELFNGPKETAVVGPRVTVVPVADENALLVYATDADTQTIRNLLGNVIDAGGKALAVPVAGAELKTFTVNLKNVPWKDAIAWYAEISGLQYVSEFYPTGTVTLQPRKDRKFTVGEITDLFNEALILQKFLLIRRKTTFILHPVDEKIDPTFMPRVEVDDLKNLGKTEIVEVEIILGEKIDAAKLAPDVRKLLSPFGEVAYAKGKRLVIRDTAGNVRRIAETLRDYEAGKPLPENYGPRLDPRGSSPRSSGPTMPMAKTTPLAMKNVPWSDVLEWYSKVSGLTPILTVKPKGNFSFTPPKPDQEYTIPEITDTLNDSLASQKLILVRRQVSFFIRPTDEKVDEVSPPRIELSDLGNYGKTELIQVQIPLKSLKAEEVAGEIKKLLSPFGTVSSLAKSNALVILDTAGNIARIWEIIQKLESENVFEVYRCESKKADDVIAELNKRLGENAKRIRVVAERASNSVVLISGSPIDLLLVKNLLKEIDVNKESDGKPLKPKEETDTLTHVCKFKKAQEVADHLKSVLGDKLVDKQLDPRFEKLITVVVSDRTNTMRITAPPDKMAQMKKIIAEFDKGEKPYVIPDPELRKYSVPVGSADAIAKTLMADNPALRLIAIQAANEIWVMATPDEHRELAIKLKIPMGEAALLTIEIIPLTFIDPKEVVPRLYRFLPRDSGIEIEPSTSPLKGIVVKGTAAQIKQVREIVETIDSATKKK